MSIQKECDSILVDDLITAVVDADEVDGRNRLRDARENLLKRMGADCMVAWLRYLGHEVVTPKELATEKKAYEKTAKEMKRLEKRCIKQAHKLILKIVRQAEEDDNELRRPVAS
jgi:hypothetical protein